MRYEVYRLYRVIDQLREAIIWFDKQDLFTQSDIADEFCEEMIESFGEYEDNKSDWDIFETGNLASLLDRKVRIEHG